MITRQTTTKTSNVQQNFLLCTLMCTRSKITDCTHLSLHLHMSYQMVHGMSLLISSKIFSRYFGAARLDNVGLVLRHESHYLNAKVFSRKHRWVSKSYQLTETWTLITVTWIDNGMLISNVFFRN